ncbi:MAG: protease inhibitor I42 family protein [Methanotrichaceae archaeon]|nr:protease inhibitor I42 family protein [Methanotrichaceae archaeon]
MMKRYAISALALPFVMIALALGSSVCDNAPCEPMINASVGEDFIISVRSNPSTGFSWWTQFDPQYLSLVGSSFNEGSASPGMVGVPGTEVFTFRAEAAGETDVYLLLLQPWENGTIAERQIFPVTIS